MADVKKQLFSLAAQMVMGIGMPSTDRDSWPPHLRWSAILPCAEKANEQARQWGIAIRSIIEQISKEAEKNK